MTKCEQAKPTKHRKIKNKYLLVYFHHPVTENHHHKIIINTEEWHSDKSTTHSIF